MPIIQGGSIEECLALRRALEDAFVELEFDWRAMHVIVDIFGFPEATSHSTNTTLS